MTLHMRPLGREDDYWRARDFLRTLYLLHGRQDYAWPVERWDYWRWHGILNCGDGESLQQAAYVWETEEGEIAAILNQESYGEVFLQVHPAWRTATLETEMIAAAEEHLGEAARARGRTQLRIWAAADDTLRQGLLAGRSYAKSDWPESARRRSLDAPIADAPPAAGYAIRTLGGDADWPERGLVSLRVFHPDLTGFTAMTQESYRNVQRGPLYRRDLDLVAVDRKDRVVGFTTVWFDDVTRSGMFEPVGVDPAHQRRGLARALLCEGLRRLKWYGATQATVGAYSEAANATYAAVGFTDVLMLEAWAKTL